MHTGCITLDVRRVRTQPESHISAKETIAMIFRYWDYVS